MAKRIKKAGLKFLLDFHYSDTWADPGKQFTPASWKEIKGSALEGQVYRYSNETIHRFMKEGVCPDMVQIGNEINHGMMWPQGKSKHPMNLLPYYCDAPAQEYELQTPI